MPCPGTVVALDQDLLPTVPRPTLLGEALDAFTAAASAAAVRFGLQTSDRGRSSTC
jgi:hypothetical protein